MKIQKDKLWHYIIISLICLVVLITSHLWYPMHYNYDLGLAAAVGIFAAAFKEYVMDKLLGWGTPELMDFFWGFVAAVVTPGLWLVVETILGTAEPLPNFLQ